MKLQKRIIALSVVVLLLFSMCSNITPQINAGILSSTITSTIKANATASKQTAFAQHGKLSVKGTSLVGQDGEIVQLKGVSTHGINWDVGSPYVNEQAFQSLRDNWGVNCIRVAMYTEEYNGYCVTDAASRKKLMKTIDKAVKATKKLGMYVIIDWHILNDQTPKKHQKQAKAFFKKVAKKYKSYGNVMYEICNEPNGGTSWKTIKSYAKAVIPVIRKYHKNAVVIVGTPNWSQDVDVAAKSPIKGKNIMYTIHFYAATHQETYRQKCETALKSGLPVICTEFSACEASGNGSYNFDSAEQWLKMLDQYNVSYCAWSLSNKGESASLLNSSCTKTNGFTENDLSTVGKWILKKY